MAPAQSHSFTSPMGIALWVLSFLSLFNPVLAQTRWIQYTDNSGTIWLDDNRQPALYTGNFGACQADSPINVTRFDAAFYKDNMTVQFHLQGNSPLTKVSLMMSVSVYAYGEPRYSILFDPCAANIYSMCPLNASIPISALGIIPVAPSDVAGIPPIALTIPDFEGEAVLRIYSNTTESQIACFSAVLTNGVTMSHPGAVGGILGFFTVVALVASVAVAVYGTSVLETRRHYAHSLSIFVVFSVFQHIFFTGALSLNWPSILVAFWSNFAWSGGLMYWQSMQNTINSFVGADRGNISMIGGAAATGQTAQYLSGGYPISQIYKRSLIEDAAYIYKRAATNTTSTTNTTTSSGPSWFGTTVQPGLPLPGNFSGFAGTLAEIQIPASNAFMTGLMWFLFFLALITVGVIFLKWTIEALAAARVIRRDGLITFRQRWVQFTMAIVLRTCYIAFFTMMFLTLYQFTLGGIGGVEGLAAVVFIIFFLGMTGVAAYALFQKLQGARFVWGSVPATTISEKSSGRRPRTLRKTNGWRKKLHDLKSRSWYPFHFTDTGKTHPHDDEVYLARFGWLSARFRRSKWWFFAFWLVYEFVRACFYGGGAGFALVQVFGLLVWEILALFAIVLMKPFESNRLNLLMVYLLGFSKVSTVALSAAFDPIFGLGRIITTVIGVIIIVIQGLLTICLLIAIIVGAVSSYLSVTRYHETIKPKAWQGLRTKYFAHVDLKATDAPPPPPPPPPTIPDRPKGPYFMVSSVRREPKIEDEDPEYDLEEAVVDSRVSLDPEAEKNALQQPSRTQSLRSRTSTSNLPYGARRHRASWSTRDLEIPDGEIDNFSIAAMGGMSRMSTESFRDPPARHRAASMRTASRNDSRPPSAATNEPSRPQRGGRHGRSASNPQRPMRRSSMVYEEVENHLPSPGRARQGPQSEHAPS